MTGYAWVLIILLGGTNGQHIEIGVRSNYGCNYVIDQIKGDINAAYPGTLYFCQPTTIPQPK